MANIKSVATVFAAALATATMYLMPNSVAAQAEPNKSLPLRIYHTGDDDIGNIMTFYIEEYFRESPSFKLTNSDGEGLRLLIATSPISEDHSNGLSSYSVVFLVRVKEHPADSQLTDVFLDNWLGSCGSGVIQSCAKHMFEQVGADWASLRQQLH